MKILENKLLNRLALESEEYQEKKMKGGKKETILNDGGFPLIYEIFDDFQENIKKREFMNDKSIINIHNILDNRKNVPFLPIRPRNSMNTVKIEYNNLNLKKRKNNI
jgi:hypothetical protein